MHIPKIPVRNLSRKYKKKVIKRLPESLRQKLIRSQIPGIRLNLESVLFRPALSPDDYTTCFRLLHDVYVQAGLSDPSSTAMRIIPHHSNPSSKVFIGFYEEPDSKQIPVYTVSLFPDSDDGLPMDAVFNSELDGLRKQGRKIVEVGCLASNPGFRMQNMNIPMLGNRVVHEYAANYLDMDDLVITVHPKHVWVYRDILLFEPMAQVNAYAYVKNNPAVAMRLNLRTAEQEYKKVYSKFPVEKNLHYFFFWGRSRAIDFTGVDQDRKTDFMLALTDYSAFLKKAG